MAKYLLKEVIEGEVREEKTFNNFEELKAYLIKNTDALFGWINDNVDDPTYYRDLPDFKEVETFKDVDAVLRDYDYDWWKLEVEEEDVVDKKNNTTN